MHTKHLRLWISAAVGTSTLLVAGCAKDSAVHQFDPVPVAQVGAQDLEPVSTPSTTELLAAADEAFQAANVAQEKGDTPEALRQYNRMLELLVEADLDPRVFYGLRGEFEHILSSTAETAALFERDPSLPMPQSGLNFDQTPIVPAQLNPRIETEINEIQESYRKNFQYGLNRSAMYRPYIEMELAKAGLPQDLVWLAMVESQFHPNVVSRAGAAGMWQFMPATARRYGLRVDKYVDERRDWQKATAAAIRYLTDLGNMFQGDWSLAISAYNMGEYGLERAIAMNGGDRDLWRLLETPPASNRIQTETKKFFPKFLASVIVGKNMEKYGFENNPQDPDLIDRMAISGMYSLASLEKASGLPSGTLKRLNPELVQGSTPPDGEFAVAVPKGSGETLLASLSKAKEEAPVVLASNSRGSSSSGGAVHVVRRGDTVSAIAKKYGVSERDLMATNSIRSANRLYTGKKLVIPGVAAEEPVATMAVAEAPKSSGGATQYRVKRNDTLSEIAARHGVTVDQLREWNNLQRRSHIRVGETLNIGVEASDAGEIKLASVAEPAGQSLTHTVQSGEFPASIAQKYGVKVDDLLAWNSLKKDTVIRVGDQLVLHNPVTTLDASIKPAEVIGTSTEVVATSKASDEAKRTHRVAAGESPWLIANKYGVSLDQLLAWNNMTKKSTLSVGQEVIVGGSGEGGSKAAAPVPTTHTVAAGESASVIASKYGMSLKDFLTVNNMTSKSVLKVGQKVSVSKADLGGGGSSEGKKSTHTVRSGESPWTIASKYKVDRSELYKWNNWSKDPSLKVGDKVVVYTK